MATPPPRKPPASDVSFFPGDRATAPMALEKDTDSAWAEFERLQEHGHRDFADTQPASDAMKLDAGTEAAFAPTQPAGLPPAAAAPAVRPVVPKAITVDEVMVLARRNNRVCPLPAQWQQMYALLPGKEMHGKVLYPPPPITGPAWNATSAMPKRMALRDHVEWAGRHGGLDQVHAFLQALPEDQWHHIE